MSHNSIEHAAMGHRTIMHIKEVASLPIKVSSLRPSVLAVTLGLMFGFGYPTLVQAVADPRAYDVNPEPASTAMQANAGMEDAAARAQQAAMQARQAAMQAQQRAQQSAAQQQAAQAQQATAQGQGNGLTPEQRQALWQQQQLQQQRAQQAAMQAQQRAQQAAAQQQAQQAAAQGQGNGLTPEQRQALWQQQQLQQQRAQQAALQAQQQQQAAQAQQARQAAAQGQAPVGQLDPRALTPEQRQAILQQQQMQQQRQLQMQQQREALLRQQQEQQQAQRALQQEAVARNSGSLQHGGVQPIPMGNGTLRVPMPDIHVDYTAKSKYYAQGNGRFDVPMFDPDKFQPVVEDPDKPADPLASPFYDPLTGGIDMEKMRKAEIEKRLEQGKKPTVSMTPYERMEDRLKRYDQEQYRIKLNSEQFQAFGDFVHHDEVYESLPATEDVFYVDREEDLKALQNKVAEMEKELGTKISFVMLDNVSLIALKDNTSLPVYGLQNFYLAYATATLMSTRGDTGLTSFSFLPDILRQDIRSPLLVSLESSDRFDEQQIKDVNNEDQGVTSVERGKGIAEYMRKQQEGNGQKINKRMRDEMLAYSSRIGKKTEYNTRQSSADPFFMTLNELLHYVLVEGDCNASHLLLSYIGALPALELFVRSHKSPRVDIKRLQADIAADMSLLPENNAPLYASARLMALFSQDSAITPEIRDFIETKLNFNTIDRAWIPRGIQNSVNFFGKKYKKNIEATNASDGLAILSLNGDSGFVPASNNRPLMSDLALIRYRQHSVVIAIALQNIPNNALMSLRNGEKVMSGLASYLYSYYLDRNAKEMFPEE